MAWGQPRATQDVDALVALEPSQVEAFVKSCSAEGFRLQAEDLRASATDGSHCTALDALSAYHVDIKLAATQEERTQAREALQIELEGGSLRLARAEETVAFKLKFGSPQDVLDAKSILARQGSNIDWARLGRFAERLGVAKELHRLRREVRDSE